MSAATTLFRLAGDNRGMFDGPVTGIAILKSARARALAGDAGIAP